MKTTFGGAVAAAAALTLAAAASLAATSHAQILLHQYDFTGDASDAVGTADGSLINGASVSGGLLILDGTDDYVQFGEKIVPTSGSYSVTLFARQSALQNGSIVEFISQGFSGGPGFYIGHASSQIRATDSWASTGVAYPSDLVQHHFALTVDAGTSVSSFYIDGTLLGTLNAAITTTSGGTNTRFGRQFEPFAEFFRGELDDVRVYSGALNATQVAAVATGASLVAAPEMGTLALLGLGVLPIVAFAARRQRRRKA